MIIYSSIVSFIQGFPNGGTIICRTNHVRFLRKICNKVSLRILLSIVSQAFNFFVFQSLPIPDQVIGLTRQQKSDRILKFLISAKIDKLHNVNISARSSKNFYIADQLLKKVYLKTDSRSLYHLPQCRSMEHIHDIVVHQFELNALIKASSVDVSILYQVLYVVEDSTTKKNRRAERMNLSKNKELKKLISSYIIGLEHIYRVLRVRNLN
jgi:hypothetical protein